MFFECSFVDLLCFVYLLYIEFVFVNEGVGDDFVVDEVEVDVGWELGNGEEFGVFFVELFEFLVFVDGDYDNGGGSYGI